MTTTSDILMEASQLEAGERIRISCVSCGGKGRTMTITRMDNGTIIWNCFRASCEERGASGGGSLVRTRHTPKEQTMKPFTGELERLDDAQCDELKTLIGWTETHIALARPLWAPEEDRFAFPIFGPGGLRRGYVLRSYDPNAFTKALTRMDEAEPHLSWYRTDTKANNVIVVEDIPSAVRAGLYTNAVALCGTGCGPDYANEIATHARHVTWALDADALSLAIKLHRDYSLMFSGSRVLPLDCDIKDMTEAQVRALFGDNNE